MTNDIHIRTLVPESTEEVDLVASRMRQTLIEVLGEEEGASMYSMEWLQQRVLWHLDPDEVVGQVFVAENADGDIVGHTIVRLESEVGGDEFINTYGLFSTTYVDPVSRRFGVAKLLLEAGEAWMLEQGMGEAVTYTDVDNSKLQDLYIGHGYTMSDMPDRFVKLSKVLAGEG